MSISTATNRQIIIGIDPGLATSAMVALQVDEPLRLVTWLSPEFKAATPTMRKKLGITKGDNNEQRLRALYNRYSTPMDDLGLDALAQRFSVFVVIEGLSRGPRPPDSMSVMSQGMLRALIMAHGWRYIALSGIELRTRLGLPRNSSKAAVFAHVRPQVKLTQMILRQWNEHTRDACALAVAGAQYLDELP